MIDECQLKIIKVKHVNIIFVKCFFVDFFRSLNTVVVLIVIHTFVYVYRYINVINLVVFHAFILFRYFNLLADKSHKSWYGALKKTVTCNLSMSTLHI